MVVERLDRALNLYRGITDQELMKQLVYVETGWIQNIKWPLQVSPIDAAAVKAAWENGLKLSPNAIFSRVLEIAEMAYGVLHNVPFRTRQEMTFKELRERIDACLFFMNDYVPNLYSLWQIIYDTDKRKINND